jgi:hypothetical protein
MCVVMNGPALMYLVEEDLSSPVRDHAVIGRVISARGEQVARVKAVVGGLPQVAVDHPKLRHGQAAVLDLGVQVVAPDGLPLPLNPIAPPPRARDRLHPQGGQRVAPPVCSGETRLRREADFKKVSAYDISLSSATYRG